MRHGSMIDPPNRFVPTQAEVDYDHWEWDPDDIAARDHRPVEYLTDTSRSIVAENKSPDIGFRYSINPYRGCQHGCSYCYARNSHEYLGMNAGLDFETKIIVKHDAAALFREFLAKPKWQPDVIVFSGITDCYQPAERKFQLTRQCLQVALEHRVPIGIITKNALVCRDIDILRELAALQLAHVNLSITTLDPELARVMEPRTSIPSARLRALQLLSDAGVPTRVMTAPIIPGLNDAEIPAILAAAKDAGARSAGYVLLRLPFTVEPVFREWLTRTQPLKAEKVEGLIRQTRDGGMYRSQWGERQRGTGPIAEQVRQMFSLFSKKHGLDGALPPYDLTQFQPPKPTTGQLELF